MFIYQGCNCTHHGLRVHPSMGWVRSHLWVTSAPIYGLSAIPSWVRVHPSMGWVRSHHGLRVPHLWVECDPIMGYELPHLWVECDPIMGYGYIQNTLW